MFTNPQWLSPIRECLSLGIPASPHHRFSTLSVKFLCFFCEGCCSPRESLARKPLALTPSY